MEKKTTQVSVLFMLFSILFCVCLIAANVLETKQIAVGPISLTGGLIVFPVSYIINDVVCEVWGYQKTRLLIWTGFAMNFFFVALGAICDWIPGALPPEVPSPNALYMHSHHPDKPDHKKSWHPPAGWYRIGKCDRYA